MSEFSNADKAKAALFIASLGGAAALGGYIYGENKVADAVTSIRPESSIPLEERQEALAEMIENAKVPNPLADHTRPSMRFDGEAQSRDGVFTDGLQELLSRKVIKPGDGYFSLELPIEVSFKHMHSSDYVGNPLVTEIGLEFEEPGGEKHILSITVSGELDDESSTKIARAASEGNLLIVLPSNKYPNRYDFKAWTHVGGMVGYGYVEIAELNGVSMPSTLDLHPVAEYTPDPAEDSFFTRLQEKIVGEDDRDDVMSILNEAGAYVDDEGRLHLPIAGTHLSPEQVDALPESLVDIGEAAVDSNGRSHVKVDFRILGAAGNSVTFSTSIPDYTPDELREMLYSTGSIVFENGGTPEEYEHIIVTSGPLKGSLIYTDFGGISVSQSTN